MHNLLLCSILSYWVYNLYLYKPWKDSELNKLKDQDQVWRLPTLQGNNIMYFIPIWVQLSLIIMRCDTYNKKNCL